MEEKRKARNIILSSRESQSRFICLSKVYFAFNVF